MPYVDTHDAVSVGTKIHTRSGMIDLLNPDPDDISIYDIALGLSRECRFTNQPPQKYSVAEHSIHCALVAQRAGIIDSEILLAILMHDASEAFTGDISKPLKNLIKDAFVPIENRIQDAIGARYGIDFDKHKAIIKHFDEALFRYEDAFLFGGDLPDTPVVGMCCEEEDAVYERFLELFFEFGGEV